jgi:hypothetical protein
MPDSVEYLTIFDEIAHPFAVFRQTNPNRLDVLAKPKRPNHSHRYNAHT